MIKNGKLTIYKKTQSQWLVWLLFLLPFICPGLIELLKLPLAVRYSMDICWCSLLVYLMLNRSRLRRIPVMVGWIGAFAAYAIIGGLFQLQSPFYLLWGIRNNFRFYVFFAAVVCFLKNDEKERYMECLDVLFWINAGISVVQYFVLDHNGDNLGGLFGVLAGANGYTNIFLVIYLAKTLLWHFNNREKMLSAYSKIGICLVIAALAELKFFFVEAAVIIAMTVVFARISFRKIIMAVFVVVALLVGANFLGKLFPEFMDFFEWENLKGLITVKTYATANDLGRFTAIPTISGTIMDSSWQRAFGFGLGNCDYAAYSFLQTPFYLQYEYLHYMWFSTAFVFLEMGWVGLIFFFGFFGVVYLRTNKLRKQGGENEVYCQLAMVTAVVCVMIGIYNSSLRSESGYLAYFIMALPFVRSPIINQQDENDE